MKNKKLYDAFIVSVPIAFGYIALGFMGGAMIQKVGFNLLEVVIFSTFVFSGSATFITANMLAGGIYPQISLYLVLTIVISNLRNMLYSSALVNDTKDMRGIKKIIFAQFVTDETFAINSIKYRSGTGWDSDHALYLNIFGGVYCLIGHFLGGFFGQIVDIPLDLGFFMMSSMFVILTVLQVRNKLDILMLFVSIIISVLVLSIYSGGLDLVIIALTVTTIGYFLDKKNILKGDTKNE